MAPRIRLGFFHIVDDFGNRDHVGNIGATVANENSDAGFSKRSLDALETDALETLALQANSRRPRGLGQPQLGKPRTYDLGWGDLGHLPILRLSLELQLSHRCVQQQIHRCRDSGRQVCTPRCIRWLDTQQNYRRLLLLQYP